MVAAEVYGKAGIVPALLRVNDICCAVIDTLK